MPLQQELFKDLFADFTLISHRQGFLFVKIGLIKPVNIPESYVLLKKRKLCSKMTKNSDCYANLP